MICAAVERCAGIDVGKKWLSVCVMIGPLEGEPRVEKRRFGTTVGELEQLRDWLQKHGLPVRSRALHHDMADCAGGRRESVSGECARGEGTQGA